MQSDMDTILRARILDLERAIEYIQTLKKTHKRKRWHLSLVSDCRVKTSDVSFPLSVPSNAHNTVYVLDRTVRQTVSE